MRPRSAPGASLLPLPLAEVSALASKTGVPVIGSGRALSAKTVGSWCFGARFGPQHSRKPPSPRTRRRFARGAGLKPEALR